MTMVILGYLICLSLGACLGFVAAGLCSWRRMRNSNLAVLERAKNCASLGGNRSFNGQKGGQPQIENTGRVVRPALNAG
jgi:hypothetical protein